MQLWQSLYSPHEVKMAHIRLDERFKQVDPIYGMPIVGYVYRKNLEVAISLTEPHEQAVLDIGFGFGVLFPYLAQYTHDCYGIDFKMTRAVKARLILNQLNVKAELIMGDISFMPFKEKSFDVIFALNVLEHIPDITLAINNIKDLLKTNPPGHLVVAAPTENWLYHLGRRAIRFRRPHHYYKAEEIENILQRYFNIERVVSIYPVLTLFKVYLCRNRI